MSRGSPTPSHPLYGTRPTAYDEHPGEPLGSPRGAAWMSWAEPSVPGQARHNMF